MFTSTYVLTKQMMEIVYSRVAGWLADKDARCDLRNHSNSQRSIVC